MRKILWVLLLFFAVSFTNGRRFTIKARISGLQINDTVLVKKYNLPFYDNVFTDTLVVTVPEEFAYTGECDGSGLFGITYHPLLASYEGSPSSITLFIGSKSGERDITLDGTAEYFTLSRKSGGYYNNEDVIALNKIEDSLNLEETRYYRKFLQFAQMVDRPKNKNYNKDSADFYFNSYRGVNDPRLKQMRDSLSRTVNDSEYFAWLYLKELSGVDYEKMNERYNRFSPGVKKSNTGKVLSAILAAKKNIRVGEKPADFTVIDSGGKTVRLSDYRGKYLLIYHWGLCPGTIWVQPKILELYAQYKDKGFDILGLTESDLEKSSYASIPGLRNSPQVAPLFDQPWPVVFTSEKENQYITDELYLNGVPILMLVAPDGTTLLRGYNDVYDSLVRILQENLNQ